MSIRPDYHAAAAAAYRTLNDSPIQRRLRDESAYFVGAVYWNPGDYTLDGLIYELGRMRKLGFNMVRFHSVQPIELEPGMFDFSRADDWLNAAGEVGIGVSLALNMGTLSPAALAKHDISAQAYAQAHYTDPALLAALEEHIAPIVRHFRDHPALLVWGGFGEPHPESGGMSDYDKVHFAAWLRERYGTLAALDRAWNIYPRQNHTIIPSFEDAWQVAAGQRQTVDFATPDQSLTNNYGARRDFARYQTEKGLQRTQALIDLIYKHDPVHPVAVGSHQLFSNNAYMRWDVPARARLGDLHYSSIHLPWHFEHVAGEIDRPVYMQARLTRDYFKGGWTSAYETTGGAVQYSGGYGHAMTPGLMRRFMCSYLAAGNLNIAFWTWNHRPGNWEAGEYGLTTLSGQLSIWALEAGKVAQGMAKYHTELWQADPQTRVGVLQSWDNDAILMQEPERHELKNNAPHDYSSGTRQQPSRAQIGVARALMNQHIPYAVVTADEILEGIALCYPVLYVPHMRAISDDLLDRLLDYVTKGGRLIADVQFAFEDQWGKMHPTGPSGWQERIFGAYVDMIHDARNVTLHVSSTPVTGFFGDLILTRARPILHYDSGAVAATELQLGEGTAIFIGFDASMACFRPGGTTVESLISALVMGSRPRDWFCTAPLAFRLRAPHADHYFLINDGPTIDALIAAYDAVYSAGEDVIESMPIDTNGTISVRLEAGTAAWVRLAR